MKWSLICTHHPSEIEVQEAGNGFSSAFFSIQVCRNPEPLLGTVA